MAVKYVYLFGVKKSEGDASMRNLLGGKGANLAEMSGLGQKFRVIIWKFLEELTLLYQLIVMVIQQENLQYSLKVMHRTNQNKAVDFLFLVLVLILLNF